MITESIHKKIRVGGVPEHFNYPWIHLIQSGYFTKLGYEIEWQAFPGGTGAMSEALDANEIDLAVMLTEGSVKQIKDGKPFQILQKYISTPLIWGVFVEANHQACSLEEIEASTAAISRFGSGSHLMTYILAERQGWNTDQLSFLEVDDLDGGVKALKNQKATYFLWEQFTTQPHVVNGNFKQIGTCPTPWPCFVVVSRSDRDSEMSEILSTILNHVNTFSETLKAKNDTAGNIAKEFSLDVNEVKKWLEITEWSQAKFTTNEFETVENKLAQVGILKK